MLRYLMHSKLLMRGQIVSILDKADSHESCYSAQGERVQIFILGRSGIESIANEYNILTAISNLIVNFEYG
jgi:hypothetical protein